MIDYFRVVWSKEHFMQLFGTYGNASAAAGIKKGFPWWLTLIFTAASFLIFRIAALFAGGIGVAVITVSQGGGMEDVSKYQESPLMMAIVLLSTVFLIAATFLFAKVVDKIPLKLMGLKKEKSLLRYAAGLVCGFIMFSAAVLMAKLTGAADIAASGEYQISYILFLIPGWIIQGFSEEFLCRGYIMTAIGKRYSTFWGVLINSLVFAVLHGLNSGLTALALLNLFLFGLFASIAFLVTENIWFVAAVHSIWNFVQGNFYGIPVSGNKANPLSSFFITSFDPGKSVINGGAFGIEGGLCATTVLLAGSVIAYILYRKKHPELN